MGANGNMVLSVRTMELISGRWATVRYKLQQSLY